MFWDFNSRDITETLKDLKHNFQDAYKNGISDKEIINEYGSPKSVANSLRAELSGQKKKNNIYRGKMTLLILCIAAMLVSLISLPIRISSCTIVLIAAVFIWFFSGSNLMIGICDSSKSDKIVFTIMQTGILLFVGFIHIASFDIIPTLVETSQTAFFRYYFKPITHFLIIVLFIFTLYSLFKIMGGNIAMFFVTMQNISLIGALFAYIDYLQNCDILYYATRHYIFTAYFVCLFTMIPFIIYTYIKSKNNY